MRDAGSVVVRVVDMIAVWEIVVVEGILGLEVTVTVADFKDRQLQAAATASHLYPVCTA